MLVSRWYKINGAGGAGHTFTCTASGAPLVTTLALEMTGVDTTAPLDVTTTFTLDTASPFTSAATGTLNHASEILISFAEDSSSTATDTFTASGGTPGFTVIESEINGSANITGALAYEVVSATTTQTATWASVDTGGGGNFGIGLDSFFGAGGGGGSFVPSAGLTLTGVGR